MVMTAADGTVGVIETDTRSPTRSNGANSASRCRRMHYYDQARRAAGDPPGRATGVRRRFRWAWRTIRTTAFVERPEAKSGARPLPVCARRKKSCARSTPRTRPLGWAGLFKR